MNFRTSHKGFTIVETLVAVAILMIAVAGPLSIANKSLTAALYARDQMIATFLAQESVEYITNIRDNNVSSEPALDWLAGLRSCIGTDKRCDASPLTGIHIGSNIDCNGGCQLYLDPANEYVDQANGPKSLFKRYFYVETKSGANPNFTDGEARVTTIVSWNEGTIPNQVVVAIQLLDLTEINQ